MVSTVALVRSAPNAIGTELTDLPAKYSCVATPSRHKVKTAWSKTIRDQYYYDVMDLYRQKFLPDIPVALRAQLWTQWPGHSPMDWLGKGVEFTAEPDHLRGTFRVFDGPVGDHVLSVLDGMSEFGVSVGFAAVNSELRDGVTVRTDVKLREVSLTPNPAYADARVLAVRDGHLIDPEPEPAPSAPTILPPEVARFNALMEALAR